MAGQLFVWPKASGFSEESFSERASSLSPQKSLNIEQVACELGYPAYISCEWALAHYGLIHQIPYRLDLMTTDRSRKLTIEETEIVYHHLQKKFFKDYVVENGISMATPKKALKDLRYLERLGLKTVSWDEIRSSSPRERGSGYAKR